MAVTSYFKHQFPAAAILKFLLTVILVICLHTADAQIGACYGTLSNNLPPAKEVIALCNQYNINRIRLYNPNPSVLTALDQDHDNIAVIVGVPNEEISDIAKNALIAISWVQDNIQKYPKVTFKYIAVGNEISPSSNIAPNVVPAMQNIHDAIVACGLGTKVNVSTVLSFGVLGQSYPPSAGEFKPEIRSSFIDPIVNFLVRTNGPFLINVYPYFAYTSNTKDILLDYALFTSHLTVVTDGPYDYKNLFDAMVDATYAALEKAGGANLTIVVSETGWPSDGGIATTIDNAKTYNSNLVKNVEKGTPRKPGKPIEFYIFDLIDENQKCPELEKHWGLFYANKLQPKYCLK